MIVVDANMRPLQAFGKKVPRAVKAALRKAGSTALRDMRSDASKRVRKRKKIRAKYVRGALVLGRPKGGNIDRWEWRVDVRADPVPLIAYPHRQTKKGISVEVNRGKRTLIKGAFLATMKSGHRGIFIRRGEARLPIRELLGSRPADALLHEGEAAGALEVGQRKFSETFARLLPIELAKDAERG